MFHPKQLLGSRALCLAPMEDVSDLPFRVLRKRLGADVVFTEFVSSEALVRDQSLQKIQVSDQERPVGIQIFGGSPEAMAEAARVATDAGADLVDINFGCPVKKIVCKDAGAAALRDLDLMAEIARSVVAATPLPVTAKTRLGWTREEIRIVEVARLLEDCGIQALTIHGRTRQDAYKGKSDWSLFPQVKEAIGIPLVGNGDILTPQDAREAFEKYGVDGVMIGRGAILDPWIFERIKHYLATGETLAERPLSERIDLLLLNLRMSIAHKDHERLAVIEARKLHAGYLRGFPGVSKLRGELMNLFSYAEVEDRLHQFLKSAAPETQAA